MKTITTLALVAVAAGLLMTRTPARGSETDDRIEAAARQSHVYVTRLQTDNIQIKSDEGVVTLTGTVTDAAHRKLAEDTVRSLPGVKHVNNELKISPPKLAVDDDWLKFKVRAALLLKRHATLDTDIVVNNGVVTVTGTADNLAQKELTTKYISNVKGVKGVVNSMTVKGVESPAETTTAPEPAERTIGEKIDDASITVQIKAELMRHQATSAMNTGITTKDGIVTVTGEALNSAERDLVTHIIKDIQGVKGVRNTMTVAK